MALAIMQPYLFPYVGYWQLIANSDHFVFFDVVKYNKKSWMNRNRILHPSKMGEFLYISVPIKKHPPGTIIKDAVIQNEENWKKKILGQLTIYKQLKAPYYDETIALIKGIFSVHYESYMSLAVDSTAQICSYLDIEFKYKVASQIEFDQSAVDGPGDWALALCLHLDQKSYINPHGGYEIFDEEKYNDHGVDIKFIKSNLSAYHQSVRNDFTAGLSIIDVLMFNSKEEIRRILKQDFQKMNKDDLKRIL